MKTKKQTENKMPKRVSAVRRNKCILLQPIFRGIIDDNGYVLFSNELININYVFSINIPQGYRKTSKLEYYAIEFKNIDGKIIAEWAFSTKNDRDKQYDNICAYFA